MSGVLKYFDSKKHSQAPPSHSPHSPVLTEADEEFLRRIASEDQGNEEPSREVVIAGDGEAAGFEGPEKVPLPVSPPVTTDTKSASSPAEAHSKTGTAKSK